MLNRLFHTCLLLFLTGFSTLSQKDGEEYNLKAAFIYNFTKYVEWDSSLLKNEFIIGVVGPSPINESLAKIAGTRIVNDKKITLRQYNTLDEISYCHILFVSKKTTLPLDVILRKASSYGTLIIGEKSGYAKQGAAMNFVIINNKLKFEANIRAINSAGLKASSQLLKLAIIIE